MKLLLLFSVVGCSSTVHQPAEVAENRTLPSSNEVAAAEVKSPHADTDSPPPSVTPEEKFIPSRQELDAFALAQPALEIHFGQCHDSSTTAPTWGSPTMYFDYTTYPEYPSSRRRVGASLLKALGASGKPATMPEDDPTSLPAKDRMLIVSWAKFLAEQ